MMNTWEWNNKLEIGIDEIDNQHKELFECVNRLVKAVNEGNSHTEISNTIDFLIRYVKEHFSSEEKLQQESNYPEYSHHKTIHAEFVNNINTMRETLEEKGVTSELSLELCSTVNTWLVEHIGITDKAFADYIAAMNKAD